MVLESAYFHPTWIRKSARRHGLSTDASAIVLSAVSTPTVQSTALKQAAILCKQLAGGKISMRIKDVYPEPIQDFPVRLNYEYAHRLIGKESVQDHQEYRHLIGDEDCEGRRRGPRPPRSSLPC